MTQIEKILESTKYVVDHSKHVHINQDMLKQFGDSIKIDESGHWLNNTPFNLEDLDKQEKAHYVLLFNTLSFSYWGDPYWEVTYPNKTYKRGSWSLTAAILRAREEGFPIFKSDYLSAISAKDLTIILRGNRQIPLFSERLQILHEVGNTLTENYDGDYRNVIDSANNDAINLVDRVIKDFPSFNDTAHYQGKKIYFHKRAQALTESTHSFLGKLKNADKLTALADYILPKKLREEKILEYDDKLSYKVDNKIDLEKGSTEEVEIRANTIWAVKYIGKDPIILNDYLWLTGREKDSPFHRTRTTGY